MDFFKKTAIGLTASIISLVLIFAGIAKLDENHSPQQFHETKALTILQDVDISIEARKVVYQPMLIAPYKEMEVFISEEQTPGFEFTSAAGAWEEAAPEGTKVEAEIRFLKDEKWTEWIGLEEEPDELQDDKDADTQKMYAMASSNGADTIQYKFIMYGNGTLTPKVQNIDWTFIKSSETVFLREAPKPQFSATATVIASSAYTSSNVISRSAWGADESYRYLTNNDAEPVLVALSSDYYEKFKDELKFSRVVEKDSKGGAYTWPLQYPQKVQKIIVHHSATTKDLDNPKQAIRDIYYYHTMNRGWGDIGYNYIIDKNGIVYEGRYGGEGVIGAHAGPGNNGSVGIVLLGNYEENEVSETMITSLSKLIAAKSKIHSVDPEGFSLFRGVFMPNIFGHKDIMATQCPGVHLYEKLPVIRSLAKRIMYTEKPQFVNDYDFEDKSDVYYLELNPEQQVDIKIKMENIGKMDWNSSTFIVVDSDPAFEGVISFPGKRAEVLAKMNESLVKPGETATFNVQVKAGKKGDIVYMNIAPVINGTKRTKDSIEIPVTIQQSAFKYELVEKHFPGKTMEKGEEFVAWVTLRNTGNTTWRKSGGNTVMLGTDHARDRISQFLAVPGARMGYLKEDEVAPGETGKFVMELKAPQDPGFYKEYFTPVVEGVTWMADSGMYFETTVFGGEYDAQVENINSKMQWKQGGKYLVTIKIRNLGKTTWTKNNMNVVVYKEYDLGVEQAKLLEDEVKPGELGTLHFVTTVDENEELKRKNLLVRPQVDGIQLLKRPIYVYYTVIVNPNAAVYSNDKYEVKAGSGTEGDIRVKISYEGSPEITANGAFSVYSGSSLLANLNAGEIAKVKQVSGGYEVNIEGKNYTKTEPIRFVPGNNSILEIDNFEHRPAWNQTLNDNEYRGVLEVRNVDGELTVINELPLEKYLKGLGEVPNYEEMDKIKTIMVAARSYAKYYTDIGTKFPGKPYDLDDDPNVCQKYIGYGFEKRAPNISTAVDVTKGQVVTYNGEIVKTPYFNQSDGSQTKNAKDVWAWDAPYLVSVSDSYCDGSEFLGHGVGLSGCGASGMAERGYNYVQILKHYYTGTEVTDLY